MFLINSKTFTMVRAATASAASRPDLQEPGSMASISAGPGGELTLAERMVSASVGACITSLTSKL
jgi:hypothetical protein